MTDTIDMIDRLEELAAWHRIKAEYAGSDWVWEARLLAAENLERRAADLRAKYRRNGARRFVRLACPGAELCVDLMWAGILAC